ncbi:alpha-2-macroglobulin-like protein 1, transcript variant X2 [Columba livia]|uniref:Alpha-2-macroglobulin-like protein 1, transcript variant X2 n=1 Tax=Columba livia TaxID=8932 RepID=A0A2I0LXZ7_COLLI|nr:alpha-2-macroglobulin-like protein 1 isoform X2 [Columba livia]PKK22298.1 alpha-2-macroglobulin-like protein 1, transcript variant X2 [Columba livia]
MWSIAFLWGSILLLPSTAGVPEMLNYAVAIPSQLYYPFSETVCLQLSRKQAVPIHVTVTLQSRAGNETLITQSISQLTFFHCTRFQVPPPVGNPDEVAFIVIAVLEASSDFQKKQKVLIKHADKKTFIQTDKPVYKPGQTVKLQIVTLDQNFIASNETHRLVELKDPKGNRIAQWLNVIPVGGIVDLSFPLAAEAPVGEYTIKMPDRTHTFRVEEYVLPKFNVSIQMPQVVTILEENFRLHVCGMYTYGKPVHGIVKAVVCRKHIRYNRKSSKAKHSICKDYTGETNKDGCFGTEVNIQIYHQKHGDNYDFNLEAVAFLKESGTGVEFNATENCKVTFDITTLQFWGTSYYYQQGAPYYGNLELKSANGTHVKNKEVILTVSHGSRKQIKTYFIDDTGMASFTLDTSAWDNSSKVLLQAKTQPEDLRGRNVRVSYGTASLTLRAFYSSSRSSVKIQPVRAMLPCGDVQQVTVQYHILATELGDGAARADFYHLVLARGSLVHHGQTTVLLDPSLGQYNGAFNVSLPIDLISPMATIFVYIAFPEGQVAADIFSLKVSKCFRNHVKLGFSGRVALPGSTVHLHLQAARGSLCSIHAVDQSVLLLRPEAELSRDSVYNMFSYSQEHPSTLTDSYSDYCTNHESPGIIGSSQTTLPPGSMSPFTYNRYSYAVSQPDVYELLKNSGLTFLTNLKIKSPIECRTQTTFYYDYMSYGELADLDNLDPETDAAVEHAESEHVELASEAGPIRTWFPETFIWTLVPINDSGTAELAATVPDSITDWKAMTFCISERHGLGISEITGLQSFKPFFMEPTLPYSIFRGESFPLKVKVFSYMKQCMVLQLSLMDSRDFEFMHANTRFTACLCPDSAKTFFWDVKATKLGKVNFTVTAEVTEQEDVCTESTAVVPESGGKDTVVKHLLVKAEGLLEEKTHTSLLCPKGTSASETITFTMPENVVLGSERAHISFLGDILGTALDNIHELLQMPSGCGEQNMVHFAPNVFITRYLEETGQLTPEIKQKAIGYLQSGYQRQLLYKHTDGSYSAFGEGSEPGNTWLTALVLKTFSQAQDFIHIDEQNIRDAASALIKSQTPSGCFKSVGKLFNNGLMGAVEEGLGMSSVIITALIHSGMPRSDPVVWKALKCIRNLVNADTGSSNLYSLALAANAFAVAGDKALRQKILKRLDEMATISDDQIFWSQQSKQEQDSLYWYRAPSVDVELTSSILMAHLSKSTLSSDEIRKVSQIVTWLIKQQNPYGGFASTQDTVVALEALALYASKTFNKDGPNLQASLSSEGFSQNIRVNNTNRLLLQTVELPTIPQVYRVHVQGQGCLFLQAILRYHIPPSRSDITFAMSLQTECTAPNASQFSVTIHARYTGNRVSTNMVLIQVELLSGYSPVAGSLEELKKMPLVKKVESEADRVILYLEEMTRQPHTYTLLVQQDMQVMDHKPANIKVYDYYMPEETTVMSYSAPCE